MICFQFYIPITILCGSSKHKHTKADYKDRIVKLFYSFYSSFVSLSSLFPLKCLFVVFFFFFLWFWLPVSVWWMVTGEEIDIIVKCSNRFSSVFFYNILRFEQIHLRFYWIVHRIWLRHVQVFFFMDITIVLLLHNLIFRFDVFFARRLSLFPARFSCFVYTKCVWPATKHLCIHSTTTKKNSEKKSSLRSNNNIRDRIMNL